MKQPPKPGQPAVPVPLDEQSDWQSSTQMLLTSAEAQVQVVHARRLEQLRADVDKDREAIDAQRLRLDEERAQFEGLRASIQHERELIDAWVGKMLMSLQQLAGELRSARTVKSASS